MSNRLAGNVLIIDSSMGNALILAGSGMSKLLVNAIAFWAADSTGACLLTGPNTAQDIIFRHDFPAGSQNAIMNPKWFAFGQTQMLDSIKAPVLTAGTAFLYLA